LNTKTPDYQLVLAVLAASSLLDKGPFKYYVIKEVGGWGQIMAILDDLQ
jgi:hypothetical protein